MQRFLTDSSCEDDTVTERVRDNLTPKLEHSDGVLVLEGSALPRKEGNRRRWPGVPPTTGHGANYQTRMFLAYVSPLGRALVD